MESVVLGILKWSGRRIGGNGELISNVRASHISTKSCSFKHTLLFPFPRENTSLMLNDCSSLLLREQRGGKESALSLFGQERQRMEMRCRLVLWNELKLFR